MLMKKYLTLCRVASEEKLLLHLVSRQHFVDGPNLYSVQDLLDVKNGVLLPFLQRIIAIFAEHIKKTCVLCRAKGFVCEICGDDDIILFPFDKEAALCPTCQGAFHRHCYKQLVEENEQDCVRCARIKAKREKKQAFKQEME